MTNNDRSRYRLGGSVTPTRYELLLVPDIGAARFDGTVEIVIAVHEMTREIVLNAAELEMHLGWLQDEAGRRMDLAAIELDETTERVRIPVTQPIEAGNYRLHLEFSGVLNDKLRGFYRSRYTDSTGREHQIATTQFEATDARRAFPCFDEPAMKAVFSITLGVEPGLLAVSNSPVVSDTIDSSGFRTVSFADTIKMSTYLVAFVIGPLEATDPVDAGGVPVRVIHARGQGRHTSFALDVARFSLQFFADYYGIPCPGQKIDLIALPDFAMGAMENLGCITFRESLLIVDQTAVTQGELRRAAMVIAHELAHMWFGDLVTMKWWNGIWLNEAFATFMEVAAVDAYRPEWRTWSHFSLSRSAAFRVDGLGSTRPIEYPVDSPEDAEGMFDVLTYEKGASVLRMLEQYLGPDQFRRGIRSYLRKYSYGNTETADLWASLEEATSHPVERIMQSWVFQPGFPRVRIERPAGNRSLRVTQERFRFTQSNDAQKQRWAIPLILRVGGAGDPTEHRPLLEESELDLPVDGSPDYVVGNVEANGFYRVSYGPELLAPLKERPFDLLAPIERFTLLDDAWAALLCGAATAQSFLELSRAFSGENDLDVWHTLSGCLAQLTRLPRGKALEKLRTEIAQLAGTALKRIGWDPAVSEPQDKKELRGLFVEMLCISGADQKGIERARAIHQRAETDSSSVEPNLAAAALEAVASVGNSADHALFVERFKSGSTPQERLRYLYALASFPGLDEFRRTLQMTTGDEVRTQDAPFLIASCLRNRYHGENAWAFIRTNWEKLNKRFPANTIVRMLSGVRTVSHRKTSAEIVAFFEKNPVPQGKLMLEQHLELMNINVGLHEREAERFTAYLLRG